MGEYDADVTIDPDHSPDRSTPAVAAPVVRDATTAHQKAASTAVRRTIFHVREKCMMSPAAIEGDARGPPRFPLKRYRSIGFADTWFD